MSVKLPEYTAEVTGVGVLRLLNVVKELGMTKTVKYGETKIRENRKLLLEP